MCWAGVINGRICQSFGSTRGNGQLYPVLEATEEKIIARSSFWRLDLWLIILTRWSYSALCQRFPGVSWRKIQWKNDQSKGGKSMDTLQPRFEPSSLLVLRKNAANCLRKRPCLPIGNEEDCQQSSPHDQPGHRDEGGGQYSASRIAVFIWQMEPDLKFDCNPL